MITSTDSRLLYDVPLQVVGGGARFQPTGFPDLGAATFERPRRDTDGELRWVAALLVESAQSMANRAEAVAWDPSSDQPVAVLDGLPWVRVVDAARAYLTSSRTEAHRLASAFVKDSTLADESGGSAESMVDVIKSRLDLRDDRPVSPSSIAKAVFALDPLCLVHGVFFSDKKWPSQPKIARALTGFVEATDVRPADSGGVKKDSVRHSVQDGSGGTAEGYGTVPYQRREWVAGEITASFSVDRAQIRSYGLPAPATRVLVAIALWEIRCLVDEPLRLRTACDLEAVDPADVKDQMGEPLPGRADLEDEIRRCVAASAELVGPGKAMDAVWTGSAKKSKA